MGGQGSREGVACLCQAVGGRADTPPVIPRASPFRVGTVCTLQKKHPCLSYNPSSTPPSLRPPLAAGNRHTPSLEELGRRHAHLPAEFLTHALSTLHGLSRMRVPALPSSGITSLLDRPPLSLLPPGPPSPAPPRAAAFHLLDHRRRRQWARGERDPTLGLRLLARETGESRAAQDPRAAEASCLTPWAFRRFKTLRGHQSAVYCTAFDAGGRVLASGADDCLVKLWSTTTCLLQASCRGHTGEITDLAVSRDDTLLASGSMDSTVVVWSLQVG